MVTTRSTNPCQAGTCTVTVEVTWRNTGGVGSSFTPTIMVDNSPVTLSPVTLNAYETVGDSIIRTFTLSDLTASTYSICPYPN